MRRSPRRGFSVASILLLTVVVAIFLAAIRTAGLPSERLPANELDPRTGAGCMIGVVVGLWVGLMQSRPRLAGPMGFYFGGIIGGLAGRAFADPKNLPVAAIGAAILLGFGLVVRLFSHHPPGR